MTIDELVGSKFEAHSPFYSAVAAKRDLEIALGRVPGLRLTDEIAQRLYNQFGSDSERADLRSILDDQFRAGQAQTALRTRLREAEHNVEVAEKLVRIIKRGPHPGAPVHAEAVLKKELDKAQQRLDFETLELAKTLRQLDELRARRESLESRCIEVQRATVERLKRELSAEPVGATV
jgi:hypothetical protein